MGMGIIGIQLYPSKTQISPLESFTNHTPLKDEFVCFDNYFVST